VREEAKVTSKGQITIPLSVRRALNLKQGDRVVFKADEAGVRIERAPSFSDVLEAYAGAWLEEGEEGRTIEEINREIRELRGHDE